MNREELTQAQRWKIAEQLSKDYLPEINKNIYSVYFSNSFYVRYVKRFLDIVFSLIAIILTLPINLIIAVVTYFDVGLPIFFKQERIGKNGVRFNIIKFRNMNNNKDENGELLPANKRVTKWGKLVRKTSLDELLNFYCVLKGDMSLIGPRPLPPQYLHRYSKRHKERFRVRPGLECPPRKKPEDNWSWEERFENDIWYVENVSFLIDCKMILQLFRFAFDKKSASRRGNASNLDFMGYSKAGKAIDINSISTEYIENVLRNLP